MSRIALALLVVAVLTVAALVYFKVHMLSMVGGEVAAAAAAGVAGGAGGYTKASTGVWTGATYNCPGSYANLGAVGKGVCILHTADAPAACSSDPACVGYMTSVSNGFTADPTTGAPNYAQLVSVTPTPEARPQFMGTFYAKQ